MPCKACLRFAVAVPAHLRAGIAGLLGQAGVVCVETDAPAGVMVLDRLDRATLADVAVCGAHGPLLCLAVAALPPSDTWALLAAGAADVLAWDEGAPAQVAARISRWERVHSLATGAAVRQALVGASRAWRNLVDSVVDVAAHTRASVLIEGETGTGKDLLAQLIARLDAGQQDEATVVDCTTLSPELSGSELFGHERGAFTGAVQARDGAFTLADGGVLFLDEIGELGLPLQAQLLRVIQEGRYKKIGSNVWQKSRFRLVCATNRDLAAEIANGSFRADLYYRIAAWRCATPPLRERRDDILPLARHFLAQLAPAGHACELDAAVRTFLLARDYPGNVRELRQLIGRLWYRHAGPGPLTAGDIPLEDRVQAGAHGAAHWPDRGFIDAVARALELGVGLKAVKEQASATAMRIAIDRADGNLQRAAQQLGVSDRALQLHKAQQRGDAG